VLGGLDQFDLSQSGWLLPALADGTLLGQTAGRVMISRLLLSSAIAVMDAGCGHHAPTGTELKPRDVQGAFETKGAPTPPVWPGGIGGRSSGDRSLATMIGPGPPGKTISISPRRAGACSDKPNERGRARRVAALLLPTLGAGRQPSIRCSARPPMALPRRGLTTARVWGKQVTSWISGARTADVLDSEQAAVRARGPTRRHGWH